MLILHKEIGNKGMFYIEKDAVILAEMVYTKPAEDKMIIEHTEVDESLKGKNIGYQLVSTAVEYAREHHYKIIPLCPFTKSVIDKNIAFQDVLFAL